MKLWIKLKHETITTGTICCQKSKIKKTKKGKIKKTKSRKIQRQKVKEKQEQELKY